jgi:autotransporter-associated beta strand protein
VTINNSSAVYTFTGGDIKGSSLGGGGGLFLGGTGAVTINSNYTAAGPIVSNKSGTGTTLVNGNITAATGVTVNGGTLTLAGTNTYTGSNTVNGGTLAVGADFNLGAVPGVPTANSIVLDSGALKTTTSFTLNSNRGITTNASNSVINNDPSTTLTYGGVISGTGGVTQTGGGTLTLSGANTYAGATTVTNGHMVVSGAAAKLGGGNVTVSGANAGTFLTISSGVTNAIADTAILSLAGGGTAGVADQGYIELGAGLNELIGTLLLNNAAQAFGTYGSTASSATFKNDEFFSGSGIVTVGMIPGDYNGDGKVDAADYVVWRDNPNAFGGDPGGYNTWRANFGAGAPATGSSLGAESAVPEPTTLLLILVMICSTLSVRRGRR